jgi:predicted metal-binding membrane protein
MTALAAALREIALSGAWPLVAVSAVGWAVIVLSEPAGFIAALCGPDRSRASIAFEPSLFAALDFDGAPAQPLSGVIMLLAMMTPLVWQPVMYVWHRSLAERRRRAVMLFLAGYFAVWWAAWGILSVLVVGLRSLAGEASFGVALAMALAWQVTALRARLLRRCHRLEPLPAFGSSADLAALAFGAAVGRACIGACWALMLLPLTAGAYHIVLMAAVAVLMLYERYAPQPPRCARPTARGPGGFWRRTRRPAEA